MFYAFRLLNNVLRSFLYNLLNFFFFCIFFNDSSVLVLKYLVCKFDLLIIDHCNDFVT